MEKQITCPACSSVISFIEGDIIERCPACQTAFVNPNAVPVKAVTPNATVVTVGVINANGGVNNG